MVDDVGIYMILYLCRDRAEVIVPFSVYRCDETALRSLATLISSSLPSLLSNSIASSMALILPSFAQQDSRDSEAVSEERRTKAHASNDLLTRHLSKEVSHVTIICASCDLYMDVM